MYPRGKIFIKLQLKFTKGPWTRKAALNIKCPENTDEKGNNGTDKEE